MDSQKDIQKTQNLSLILDGKPVRTNPFGDNRAAERAYRRAERISTAAYLITNHISEAEPARAALRKEAADLLSDLLSIRDEMRSSGSSKTVRVYQRIRQMISLTRLLAASGLVSVPNMQVLVEALDELGNFVSNSQKSALSENVVVSREELMDIGASDAVLIKDKSVTVVKDRVSVRDTKVVSYTSGDRKKTADVRVRNILEVVRAGGELSIKEIAANLPEYGEKTIQRELLSLVEQGQLRKIGLKRWSKYSLPA